MSVLYSSEDMFHSHELIMSNHDQIISADTIVGGYNIWELNSHLPLHKISVMLYILSKNVLDQSWWIGVISTGETNLSSIISDN
jgi:hypothetical protein